VGAILSYGTYVPYWRLRRDSIGDGGANGTRAVASYDEDSTSMAAEAARRAIAGIDGVSSVLLATASPPYMEKTNAVAVHAALDLEPSVFAADVAGSVRSGIAALRMGAQAATPALVALSDVRTGLPGSADERDGGDGAAAFVLGPGDGIADIVGIGTSTLEVLDRWRIPKDTSARTWEERFAEAGYVKAAESAFADALKAAGTTPDDIDRLIVTGLHARSVRTVRKTLGVGKKAIVPDLLESIGNTGTAHAGIMLASVLDLAGPGELIAVVVLADGADALMLRTSDRLVDHRQAVSLTGQLSASADGLPYLRFLSWRGMLNSEPPRRPDPDFPMAPPAMRRTRWKFGLVGTRCEACSTKFAPPQRVCLECGAVDEMVDEPFADSRGVVRTFTFDRLAFTPSPPLVMAVIDVDGGGRIECEVTDIPGPDAIAVGDRVELTFRRLYSVGGVHNYFWKARPVRASGEARS
jgi:hydroxymethylglutaryl-CoA synthase